MKIIIYIIYLLIFSFFYYFVNKRVSNKWIFIGYSSIFVIASIAFVIIVRNLININGKEFVGEWPKLFLMMITSFCLFNIFYGIVNQMIDAQSKFHNNFGTTSQNPVRYFMQHRASIKSLLYFFFYTAGTVLIAIMIYTSNL